MAEDSRDRGEWDAGGNGGDAEGVAEALGACLRSGDPGPLHDGGDPPVSGCPGPGPERFAGASCPDRAQSVDELEGPQHVVGQRDLAPVLGAALECADPDRRGVQVDICGAQREDLGEPGAGVGKREREGLPVRLRFPGRGGQEPVAFFVGEVFAAFGVDELDGALDHE